LVANLTKFDERHCHKWALLLRERREKLNKASALVASGDFGGAKRFFSEIFYGASLGESADPGMAGSLLYHMAMVTKMETETELLQNEFQVHLPDITGQTLKFYGDFVSDADELTGTLAPARLILDPNESVSRPSLSTNEKISLFTELTEKTKALESMLNNENPNAAESFEDLFQDWTRRVLEMRLRQEYETIKGLLVTAELAKVAGIIQLRDFMDRAQDRFGEETVRIALDVTLKVGLRREKLQSIMLSDHFINYTMDAAKLDGSMQFLNCPIFGSHKYIGETLGISEEVAALFCTHFCYAHARAMLNTVLPFTFGLWQPQRMAPHGKCEFYLKLGFSPAAPASEKFVPLVLSWNVTLKCNLKCSHCYINAGARELSNELDTEEAKNLMDQISEVSRPLLILSGGEPLLRPDIYGLVRYGAAKGFKMGLGSNGSLIDDEAAKKLRDAGITTVSISLDSNIPEHHDEFRSVKGCWEKAVRAVKALRESGVLVQVNTTVTQQNYEEIDDIMTLSEGLGVENFHLFFLVPTGRGAKLADISPAKYEDMIRTVFAKSVRHRLNVRPSCAPQFMRIAKDIGLDMRQWIRGCIAGLYYCRVYPNGDITPCPYLPVKLGNIREKGFKEIWFNSRVLRTMRDFSALKGKCGICDYRDLCGGCRARAYGLSGDFIDYCGDLHEPAELKADYLTEDPWCVYQPPASLEKAGLKVHRKRDFKNKAGS
jgi:radical SAM protein with 4Fe4S-binding SPASM domain